MTALTALLLTPLPAFSQTRPTTRPTSWTADNGNGTYSNPLFYDEFSDPDVIRVGTDYYLAGTTMHAMPALIVLHSKDLVNWTLASYCADRLDFGPAWRLQGGEIYGQGIWAPCIRHHDGTFYIFSNINGVGTQVFRSTSPAGPWTRNPLKTTLYDLSVLFDDDGKIWAIHGVDEVLCTQLNAGLTDVVPNTRRVLIPRGRGMGEGLHAYKVKGKYYVLTALPGAHTNMRCARADSLTGPWTVETLVDRESLGVPTDVGLRVSRGPDKRFDVFPRDPNAEGGLTIHQGGIVDTPSGQWWTVIMQDHGPVGRLSCLAPVTWTNDWPLLGLPGNLRKAPATWVKPDTGWAQDPTPTFVRNDDFDAGKLLPVWQWNHVPDDAKWSLTERPGHLRLHALPAATFWTARNTLTQRAIGPESTATVEVDVSAIAEGDVAGLGLLNYPYAWIGVVRHGDQRSVRQFSQLTNRATDVPLTATRLWLRVHCDFDTSRADFSFSTDGRTFTAAGEPFVMAYQLKTFQGVRYSLFNYATAGGNGHADFDDVRIDEPCPHGLTQPIPYGKSITLTSRADGAALVATTDTLASGPPAGGTPFRVVDRTVGRIALQTRDGRFVSASPTGDKLTLVAHAPTDAETFQWVDLQRGDLMLMSLATHRYLRARPDGPAVANHVGPRPDRRDGSCFAWTIAD